MDTYNAPLKQGLRHDDAALMLIVISKTHQFSIVSVGVHATHQTLVVTKEENGYASSQADDIEERLFVVSVGEVVLGQDAVLNHRGHSVTLRAERV